MPATTFTIADELKVTRLGFGAGRITGTGYWGPPPDPAIALAVLRQAVERGVTLIDTADNYGPDVSEELISQALHPYPADLVIATKGGVVRTGPDVWHHAGRPDQLRTACVASLRRLRLDTIPLYQLHRFDPAVPVADQLGTLSELRAEGKIRHIGLDTVTADQLRLGLSLCPIASVQNHYNLYHREHEDVLRLCEQRAIAFLPYLPLAGGSLARDKDGENGKNGTVASIAQAHDATPGQIAVAWLLHRSPVTLPTPGTKTLAYLAENLAAVEITLSGDELSRLDAVTR